MIQKIFSNKETGKIAIVNWGMGADGYFYTVSVLENRPGAGYVANHEQSINYRTTKKIAYRHAQLSIK